MVDRRRVEAVTSDLADQYSEDLPEDDGSDDPRLFLCFFSIILWLILVVKHRIWCATTSNHFKIIVGFVWMVLLIWKSMQKKLLSHEILKIDFV